MSAKIVGLPRPGEPNIRSVFDEFIETQRTRLAPRTLARYEAVLDVLSGYLNGYAHEFLSASEAARFERAYNAQGDAHREFCDLFGPEMIVESLDNFLGYYMIRKVIAGEDFLRAAGTVTNKLSKWLAEKGYVSREAAGDAVETSASAARDLPRVERAARILREAADGLGVDAARLAERDYREFDHFTIVRVEPGRLWLEVWEDGKACERGPIPAPEAATRWLRPGWTVSCSMGRVRGSWRLLELANVYPG
ncbi:MAG: hypothetical protein HYY28_14840 [Betaproteobacteria bacterium]|nr:hypothetical protein [Betaproteobacteria bacterium]MBI2961587.1 hypothetical protein [Betaproteobacteria bacterium]